MIRFLFCLFVCSGLFLRCFGQKNDLLWYNTPAKKWTEALPVGNGMLGAMIFGDPSNELLQLNEATLWSGGPVKPNVNPKAPEYLMRTRELLLKNENYQDANKEASKMQGVYSQSFLPMADLKLKQDIGAVQFEQYVRDLSIDESMATVRFKANGVAYKREIIATAPGKAIVVRLSADKPGMINFFASVSSQLKGAVTADGNNGIIFKGKAPSQVDPNYIDYNSKPISYDEGDCRGMRVAMQVRAVLKGGTVRSDTSGVKVKNADEVLLFICAATSFNGFDKCPVSEGKDEVKISNDNLLAVTRRPWKTLLTEHVADYSHYFTRVKFTLGSTSNVTNAKLPTNERLIGFSKGVTDPAFETLLYQYGRYLLISSSRPGGPPANLQGIWNASMRPPWSSNYTININTQMNYWPAAISNLEEMEYPLFKFINDLAITGKETAKYFYHMKGWVAHHNSDIWALSNPVGDLGKGDPKWANWYMAAPWLSRHLYEHYRFTQDKDFLKKAYPVMKGAAEFLVDYLVEDKNGYLVTAPSFSPENEYYDDKGKPANTSVATTMDMSIIRDHFRNCIEASEALKIDAAFRKLLQAKLAKLYPLHIGKAGNLQEWYKDWKDVEPHHRHVSHLFGLHPGREISPLINPDIAAASKKTLELRGDEGTGWSLAWKINFWARLLDGDHAYKLVRDLMRDLSVSKGGGLYPNLFDAHPPFQIDGNFGATSGITEMLLQSQFDELHLLPALPTAWANGKISGLKARGAFTVDMEWDAGKLKSALIRSGNGGNCIIRTSNKIHVDGVKQKVTKTGNGYLTTFLTSKGKVYKIMG